MIIKKISKKKRKSHGGRRLTLRVRWINLARFLGLWGSLEPLMAMKSSSFSLLVRAITNLGGQTGGTASLPADEDPPPPFLLSWAVSDEADLLSLLWWWLLALWWLPLLSWSLAGEENPRTPLLCPFMALEFSEFLKTFTQQTHRYHHIPYISSCKSGNNYSQKK